jgi:crotonobetainyl-CoA:carnitine CoA-transferase CaiB-like acyl-CoA transferase
MVKKMKEKLLTKYNSHVQPGPLNGVVVVGFCYYLAGPIALQSLVRQGALVIKLEGKPAGDPSRKVFSPSIFNTLTHGQLSVAFDYKQKKDRQLLQKLLSVADVIVDNRSIDAQERDELLQNYLKSDKTSPKIYCAIQGFPNAEKYRMPGLDASVQAMTGLPYSNCSSASEPLKVGIPVLDIVSGLLATNHIMANLYFLKAKAVPISMQNVIRIAVSLAGTSMWLQSNQVIDALEGNEYFRKGNQDRFAAPFSYYTTKNGLISIATVNDNQFESFCLNILKDRNFHQKYSSVKKRIEDQDNFERELNALLKTKDKEYWLKECELHRIPASAVLTVSEAVQQDFFKELVTFSSDNSLCRPIITAGVSNSMFFSKAHKHVPAPTMNQDHQSLSQVLEIEEDESQKIRAKL